MFGIGDKIKHKSTGMIFVVKRVGNIETEGNSLILKHVSDARYDGEWAPEYFELVFKGEENGD